MSPTTRISNIKDMQDLVSVAAELERYVAAQYDCFSQILRRHAEETSAAEFVKLREQALNKADALDAGGALADEQHASLTGTQLLEILGPIPEENDLSTMASYQLFAAAVCAREAIFRFYSSAAAISADEAMRTRAEAMATENLIDATVLRPLRRRAYHARRQHESVGRFPESDLIESLMDLVAMAAVIETSAAEALSRIPDKAPDLVSLTEDTLKFAESLTDRAQDLGQPNKSLESALSEFHPSTRQIALQTISRNAFSFYDSVVDRAVSEDVMLLAQDLSQQALTRIEDLSRLKPT